MGGIYSDNNLSVSEVGVAQVMGVHLILEARTAETLSMGVSRKLTGSTLVCPRNCGLF